MGYFINSILCLLILLLVHQLFLQHEVMHRFNRFYLLGAVCVSFLIPFHTIEIPVEKEVFQKSEVAFIPLEVQVPDFQEYYEEPEIAQAHVSVGENSIPWIKVAWGIYGLITLILLIRFLRNIKVLVNLISRNIQVTFRGQTLVLLNEEVLPFTFLKYIFVSKEEFENQKLTEAVLNHEIAHVHEKHSWDNIFIEALLVPFWFHPGLYWAKANIKLNHEFIADEVALRSTTLENYESQLLTMMLSGQNYGLVSSLNFSLTKKRFEMMKRKSRNSMKWIKVVALIPVLGLLIYGFSERVTAKQDDGIVSSEVFMNASDSEMAFDFTFKLETDGKILFENEEYDHEAVKEMISERKAISDDLKINLITSPTLSMGEFSDFQAILRDLDIRRVHYVAVDEKGINTSSEMAEYQVEQASQLNQKANIQDDEKAKRYGKARFLIETEQMEYIEKTYSQLTTQQKERLLMLPDAPQKKSPDLAQFNKWKDKDEFALWLDGKVISDQKLNEMEPSDIIYFSSSKVYDNARTERFPQPFQVSLYTATYYEETYGSDPEMWKPIEGTITLTPRATWMRDLSTNPDMTTEYLQIYSAYEKLRTSGVNYINKSKEEQEKLDAMFSDLGGKYFKFNAARKSKMKRPEVPFAPYMKLEKDGEVYYKLQKDLTEEERKMLPPPPPPVERKGNTVSSYLKDLSKFELMKKVNSLMGNRTDKEIEELYGLFVELGDSYSAMALADRGKVNRPNFPYPRFENDGEIVFKNFQDLTTEERSRMRC